MRKLTKRNSVWKDTIETYACSCKVCSCYCACGWCSPGIGLDRQTADHAMYDLKTNVSALYTTAYRTGK